MEWYDVIVIGGGPAGLAAAAESAKNGSSVLLLEREARAGGILKQCIHDGFGLIRFKEKLSGPEYTERFIEQAEGQNVHFVLNAFVTKISKKDVFDLTYVCAEGTVYVQSKAVILATGCRERTSRQVFIQGTRPAGIFSAGTAQYYVNILGKMPTKKCVILGSGDIGLIMARRLTLEGAKVEGVYEIKPTPSGLSRNIAQCLEDFNIPLYLSHTVTRVFGSGRVSAVEVAKVENNQPVKGTERIIDCDALILSVGLIPENEIAEQAGVPLDKHTKGALVDQNMMTAVGGIFSCGNALHVNDLVDYVSESAEIAARAASSFSEKEREQAFITVGEGLLYVVPQRLDLSSALDKTVCYFRAAKDMESVTVQAECKGKILFSKQYRNLRPPEMQRVIIDFGGISAGDSVTISVKNK